MLELEVYRAGSREGKMDVKCGRQRTHWSPRARAGTHKDCLEPMSVSHYFLLQWCECPAEEVGALPHRVKCAPGSGLEKLKEELREGVAAAGLAAGLRAAPHHWGEPADNAACVNCNSTLVPLHQPSNCKLCCCFTSALQLSGRMSLLAVLTRRVWGKGVLGNSQDDMLQSYPAVNPLPTDNTQLRITTLIKLRCWKHKTQDKFCQARTNLLVFSYFYVIHSGIKNLAQSRHCT